MTQYQKVDIKRAVSNGRLCTLEEFRNGCFWFKTEDDEMFSVPLEDSITQINAVEKGIFLMRYMRKWNKDLETGGSGDER